MFKNNSKYIYYSQPVSAHRQICMRTDHPLFKDARVRRAVALTINRPQQLARVMLGNGHDRQRQPVLAEVRVDRSDIKQRKQNLQLAKASAGGGRGRKPEVHADDLELPRPPRPRGVDPGIRAPGRDHRQPRDDGRRPLLRLGTAGSRLRDHDAVALATGDADRVRVARRPEPLPHALLHVHGRLERVALQEPRSSTRRRGPSSPPSTFRPSARERSGWPVCSFATPRSSRTTSSAT